MSITQEPVVDSGTVLSLIPSGGSFGHESSTVDYPDQDGLSRGYVILSTPPPLTKLGTV